MAEDPKHIKYYFQRLAEYMACSPGTLHSALERQTRDRHPDGTPKRIGEILQEQGVITRAELEIALRRQRIDRLSQCYIFEALSQPELSALSSRFREVTVAPYKQFIIQDEYDPTLFVLAVGTAEVYRTDIEGNWTRLALLAAGDAIGEMGYFQDGHRNASVRTVERCELLCANYSDLTHYFENVPRVAHNFMKLVQQRQQATPETTATNTQTR